MPRDPFIAPSLTPQSQWMLTLSPGSNKYRIVEQRHDGSTDHLATVISDAEGGDYTPGQLSIAKLIIAGPLLAQKANLLADEYVQNSIGITGGSHVRGDEPETIAAIRLAADYLRNGGIESHVDASDKFSEDFRILAAAQYDERPEDSIRLNLPLRVDQEGVSESMAYDLLRWETPKSVHAENSQDALKRSAQVAPLLLAATLRLTHSARMEQAIYEMRPKEKTSFHLYAATVTEDLGKFTYPTIGKLYGQKLYMDMIRSQRNELAALGSKLLSTTERSPINEKAHDGLSVIVAGIVYDPEKEPLLTLEQLDDARSLNKGSDIEKTAARLAAAGDVDRTLDHT